MSKNFKSLKREWENLRVFYNGLLIIQKFLILKKLLFFYPKIKNNLKMAVLD